MNRLRLTIAVFALGMASPGLHAKPGIGPEAALRCLVMDPLSSQLACACVDGHAQRRYDQLAAFLERQLQRDVRVSYAEGIPRGSDFDIVIGKASVVRHDARRAGLEIRSLAMLTDKKGMTTLEGLFVVRNGDPARSIADLRERRLVLGPADQDEKHSAALGTLEAFDLPIPAHGETSPACNVAALAVVEGEADATVVSDYAMPLLTACGTLDKGELRVIGRTDPVPFIAVYATRHFPSTADAKFTEALESVVLRPALLAAMESRDGFIAVPPLADKAVWTDWRGPRRQGKVDHLPSKLPAHKRLLWSRTLTGPGMSSLAMARNRLIVADKCLGDTHDIWRCLDADTGRELWTLRYSAPGDMDFTNSARACPVIIGDLVYLLGAFGDLHCVKIDSGDIVWRCDLKKTFKSELPTWGWCSTPLQVGDLLIINPGAPKASLVALDRRTGKIRWQAPGDPPGYAAFILATLGGRKQIIGYDSVSAGGWDPRTGRRLWMLVPEHDGDFNVATPVVVGDQLLLCTENNGSRLYAFDEHGSIIPKPLAHNEDLVPGTSTPVVCGHLIIGNCNGLYCLDSSRNLITCWQSDDDPYYDHACFIADRQRVLVIPQSGPLHLLKASEKKLTLLGELELFDDVPDTERDVWSHPVLVGNRLYIRNLLGVYCFLLPE